MTATSESIARRKAAPKMVSGGGMARSLSRASIAGGFMVHSGSGKVRLRVLDMSGVERHELVKGGLSTQDFMEALEAYSVISPEEVLRAVGLSAKTLGRREEARLGPRHSDAALALIEVTDMAQRVLGTRRLAEQWLKEPALALDGKPPLNLISSAPGIETVKDLLTRMEYGVYA